VTVALAQHVERLDLPPEPGVSARAVRSVLRMMARIANDAGNFRYGLRGSKLAALTDYSLSVVRRAQRYLVEQGYIERIEVGGGRASTRWRIVVDKIVSTLAPGHSSQPAVTHQPALHDTAQARSPKSFQEMNQETPAQKRTANAQLGEILNAPLCEHGGLAGLLPDGRHRCPQCRSSWRAARRD
jgi:hypothetical protein